MKFIPVISIIFFLAFRPLVPVVQYVLNYDQIVREFCINRAKQEMMCKGKCYLFEEISKTSDKGSSAGISSNPVKILEIYIYSESLNLNLLEFGNPEKKSIVCYFENLYDFRFSESVFHPPISV